MNTKSNLIWDGGVALMVQLKNCDKQDRESVKQSVHPAKQTRMHVLCPLAKSGDQIVGDQTILHVPTSSKQHA